MATLLLGVIGSKATIDKDMATPAHGLELLLRSKMGGTALLDQRVYLMIIVWLRPANHL